MDFGENENKRATDIYVNNEPKGHVFCFLPLPLENKSLTGLPVHVNGFFALSQNRRHLKWPSAEQDETTLTDKSLLWNKGLLKEVLPKAYAELILHVISCLSEDHDAYGAWPDINKVDVKWRTILQPLFEKLLNFKVLHSNANGGVWCKVEEVLLDDLKRREESKKIVIDVLNRTGRKVVTVPEHVKTAVQKYRKCPIEYVTPRILRNSLKADRSCYSYLSHNDKILLLKFILSDSDFKDLEGLELLPLSDKTFTAFRRRNLNNDPIYIDSAEHPKSLLPRLQRMFLDTNLDIEITEQLIKAVEKGHTQLCHFNEEAVKRHLHQTLPSGWLGSDDHVTWYPGTNKLTVAWLKTLWLYFGKYFGDIQAFVGLPLVPLTPLTNKRVQLARIQRPSSLVLTSFNGESTDKSVCEVLKALGLTVLNELPYFVQHYPGLIPNIANPASPKGVLNAMGVFENQGCKKSLLTKLKELRGRDIRKFRKFLSNISKTSLSEKNLLGKLPLFEIWGVKVKDSRFVSLEEVKRAAPIDDDLPSLKVSIDLLDLQERSSRDLARLLDTSPMSKTDLLKIMLDEALKNKYSGKEIDEIVKYIFKRFGTFSEEDEACLTDKLQRLPFVAYGHVTCSRKKPGELFDPSVKILSKIFLDEDVFPEEKYYAQPEVLIHLRKLGLRGKDGITASDIFRCASLISHKKDADRAGIKSTAILKLLEQAPSLLEEKVKGVPLKSCLDSIPWIPVFMTKPKAYPNGVTLKKSKNGSFACPKDVKSHEFINLVGSVKPLVNSKDFPTVSARFKWSQQPSLDDVILHLRNVMRAFQNNKGMNVESNATKCFKKMYSYFQKRPTDERDEVKKLLSPLNFIVVQNHLLFTNQVVFSSQVNYPPYLCQVPEDYNRKFHELLKTVGVRESFEIHDYIKTLEEVKHNLKRNTVSRELIQKVIPVLNLLNDAMEKEQVTAAEAIKRNGSIFIPDSKGIMRPSTKVCVKDCYWMPDEDGVVYANKSIPPQVCIALGAKTRRQETLRKHTFGLPFGQKEKLTNRLKRILTGYPCDESILKELLQNADDAKATKISFINDPRQHRDERVFEKGWKPLQGPALCVYNNAPFTESDIKGIQNLGEGNKGDDPNKTGQYGIGFNAVYHLTDAPTFISQGKEIGEVMCVFDPLLKFAPGADASNPGVMYRDLPRLRKVFTDVFPCYDLGHHLPLKNATMFRFPLRNEDLASTSTISNKAMTIQKLDKLLKDFKEELLQVLLFVNNVNDISICEIDKKTGNLSESYRVQSLLSPEDEKKRREFAAHVNQIGKHLQSGEMSVSKIPVHQVSFVIKVKDSKGLNQKWFVVQRIGYDNKEEIPDNIDKAFKNGDLGLLPRGGVAALISTSDRPDQEPPGKAFCFLPLPGKTGLPVNINGHFALDHEARRSLWRDDKGDCRSNWNDALLRQVVAPCYVTLLDEVRKHISLPIKEDGKTYINDDRDKGERTLSSYIKLFPSMKVQDKYWMTLCKEVYCQMNAKSLRLLPVLRQENKEKRIKRSKLTIEWLPPTGEGCKKAFFDNLAEVFQDDIQKIGGKRKASELEKDEVLRDTLVAVGFNLLCMPMDIYQHFKDSTVDVSVVSPKDVIDFFGTYETVNQLCKVGRLPSDIRGTQFKSVSSLIAVLKYCKRDAEFLHKLDGLPLLLTEDKVLRVFSQSKKVFLSHFDELLPRSRSIFVHHTLSKSVFHRVHEPDCVPVFKRFDIKSFVSQLHMEIDPNYYRNKSRCVSWKPENKDIPNKKWIKLTWKFFSTHIEKRIKDYENRSEGDSFHSKRDETAKKRLTQEALEPVKDWCLFPAVSHKGCVKDLLAPLALAETVIYLEGTRSLSLKASLRKLILPELNCSRIFEDEDKAAALTLRRIVADLDDPKTVLTALLHKLKVDSRAFKSLQDDDCRKMLSYFNDHLTLLDPLTSGTHLKKLPLYLTIHGDIVNISGKKAFVLSPRIPKDDMDIWEEDSGVVFLKESETLENLYEFLQCHSKENVDVYCEIIFDKFEDMREEARLRHLSFVEELLKELTGEKSGHYPRDVCEPAIKDKGKKLCEALFKLKFIKAKDGSFKTPSSFYDPSNEVFKVMFEDKQEMFPPEPFCREKWLPFLRQIGLVQKVSNMQFLQFAKEVEREAKTRLEDGARRKSEVLVTYLFECENITTSLLLVEVKGVYFIFPYTVDRTLQRIYAQYGSGQTGSPCICFQGSVASKDHLITWSTANLLPDYANPMNFKNHDPASNDQKNIAQRLGILAKPTVDMVVNHCKNICSVLNKMENVVQKPEQSKKVVRIMTSMYKYLEKNYHGNEEVINELQKTSCIVVDDGKHFVFPNQVVVEFTSDQEIRPFLYKIPLKLAAYAEFFEKLGTTNIVTAAQYSMVLKNIHDECGNKKLHPNETSKAFKATKGFFETIDKDRVQATNISPLYLPGVRQNPKDGSINMVFLRMSKDVLYNDAPHFKERIKQFHELILVKLADCGLDVSNEDLLVKNLPESIRPGMVTSVVHETLIEGSEPLSCSSTAQELRQILTSSEFSQGMIRLIKHADHESDTETPRDIVTIVKERLSCIRVYSIPKLQTRLVYSGKTIPGSEADLSCFVEETEEGNHKIWNIYIEKGAELVKYASVVAEIVDRISGHLLKKMLVHLPILLFSKPHEIKGLLDGLKIREDNSMLKIEATCLPTPGNFIHISDHHLLVDDFVVFSPGEYVGYEVDDPSLRGEDGTPTYIYAIVIEEVTEEGQTSSTEPSFRRYRIDIGKDKEPIVVDAADLYKFYRPNQGNSQCLELDIIDGPQDERPLNLDESRKEVRRILKEAWKLPEEKRKKIVKRLFLKWHPDKNPGNEEFCTEMFKFIQSEIRRMGRGEDKIDFTSEFYNAWQNRAKSHKKQRTNFHRDGGFPTSSSSRRNPQPGEARRWFKQAKADLEAANNDLHRQRPSYEWACFKCHQSAEKSMKAAQYSIDADKTNVHDLRTIAQDLNNANLRRLASDLEILVGHSTHMRYPDRMEFPKIPHDVYTRPMASSAIDLASAIIREVDLKFIT